MLTKTIPLVVKALCLACLLPLLARGQADTGFRQSFEAFRMQTHDGFYAFRDSINREYAEYLSAAWEQFHLQPSRPVPLKPLPDADILYIPGPDSLPSALPVDSIRAQSYRQMEAYPPSGRSQPKAAGALQLRYFGLPVALSRWDGFHTRLRGIDEAAVSTYWLQLAEAPYHAFLAELMLMKDELCLNDWALYQLIVQAGERYFQPTQTNEQAVFAVFMLNQLGYRAKIGRLGNALAPLLTFQTEVYGRPYVRFAEGNYYLFHTAPVAAAQVYSYRLNYAPALAGINLTMQRPVRLSPDIKTRELPLGHATLRVDYNLNLIALYDTWPQTELQVYANAPLSAATYQSLERELAPFLRGKGQKEAAGWLLAFVQSAFRYQNDVEQFGREKYFFAEELLHYPFSDCEDRAILFSQLARRFAGLEVALLDYPNHVAAAVKLNEPTEGDYVEIHGERYIVCDPTYIGAPIGKAMTHTRKEKAHVLVLN